METLKNIFFIINYSFFLFLDLCHVSIEFATLNIKTLFFHHSSSQRRKNKYIWSVCLLRNTLFSPSLAARLAPAFVWRSIESPWLAICSRTAGGVCAGWGGLCMCVGERERVCACTGAVKKPWGSALSTEPFLLLFKLDQRQ